MEKTALYPLQLERQLVERIWGGTQLIAWLELPSPRPQQLAESWQVFDSNQVLNGPLAGLSLAEVTQRYGAALVGGRSYRRYGADFPLLVKFIDAGEKLSIQVHPDDAYAHDQERDSGFHGKTEAWYILEAAPGAEIIHGLSRRCGRAELAAAAADGALEPLLRRLPVSPGDSVFVPAGTLHAINDGIMLFEIQQKSDLTYRVYDYDRREANGEPRELHLQKALDVLHLDVSPMPSPPPQPLEPAGERCLLISCEAFALERWRLSAERPVEPAGDSVEILTAISGRGLLRYEGGELPLGRGASLVIPAALPGYQLLPQPGEQLELLRVYVPEDAPIISQAEALR